MDPLSVTLAVVAFATAVKDLTELAQAICDAFAKAPQNYKKALRLASDILRTSKQIQTLYSKKKEILESANELKDSLDELIREMSLARSECTRLVPPVSEKIQDRFKIAFYSFWSRQKVEDMVSGLKTHIDSIYRDFSLLSSIRTEATVNQISQVVNTGTVVRVQSTFQERYQGNFITFPELSDTRLAQFFQSRYTPMTRIGDTISDTDIYKLVLGRELVKIEKSLGRSISRFLEDRPWENHEVSPLQRSWNLDSPPVSGAVAHQSLLIDAFQLQSLIDSSNFSEIDLAISSFSHKLKSVEMFEQDLTVTLWGVKFWRQIISSSLTNDSNAWAHLAQKLTDAAMAFANIGDRDNAYAQSQEAIDIAQEKLDGNLPVSEVQEHIAQNLRIQVENINTSNLSDDIELATKAAITMDAAIDLRKTQADQYHTLSGMDSSSRHDSLYTLLKILLALSDIQKRDRDLYSEAHITKKRALMISHSLLLEYPSSQLLLQTTATTVLCLCHWPFYKFNSLAENLAYAEEGTNIYRKLRQIDSPTYLVGLFEALSCYHDVLCREEMFDASKSVFEEMIAISQLISQKFQDSRIPSCSDSRYQLHLARFCCDENHSSEGVYAAYNAMEQYSAMAIINPDRSLLELIQVLAVLCEMLQKTNQYQSAVIEGFKALPLVDDAMEKNSSNIPRKIADSFDCFFESTMTALAASSPYSGAVNKASALFARFKKYIYSLEKWGYSCAFTLSSYIGVLEKNALVDDHGQLEDFLSTWGKKCILSPTRQMASSHLFCMRVYIDYLKKHNRTEDALRCSKNSMAILEQCSRHANHEDYPIFLPLVHHAVVKHSYLLCSVGLFEAALELSQAVSLQFDPSNYPSGVFNSGIFHERIVLAQMQLYNYLPLQALETATQVEAFFRIEISKSQTENPDFLLMPRYYSMYVISSALFDLGRISESCVFLTQIKDGIQGRINDINQSEFEEVNCFVLSMIARISFVQSDYAQAKDMAFKALETCRKIFEKRETYFSQLAFNFLVAGMTSCCVDEHEAGVALLAELEDLQQKTSVTRPALANEVVFYLNMHAQRGHWKLIQTAARAKLTCNHVERALNLKMAWSDNSSGLIEVVEE